MTMILQGANLITGAIILNGVACGMIYRPLEANRRKMETVVDKGREANVPRSVIFRRIIEEKRRRRTTSTGSLDGSMITRDNRVIKVDKTDAVANSLHQIPEDDACSIVNEVRSVFYINKTSLTARQSGLIMSLFYCHILKYPTINAQII